MVVPDKHPEVPPAFEMCVKAHSAGTSSFLAYMSIRPVKRLTLFYLTAPSFLLAFLI